MNRILRLGFAMGGGASLGSFSGAALAESIKQLLVYGQYAYTDAQGQTQYRPYDDIQIDVFSGSSAGAIALGLMLRVLVNPTDKYQTLGFAKVSDLEQHLEKLVLGQFGEDALRLQQTHPHKYQSLLAAQAMQLLQEKIWVEEVDLQKLLGTGKHYKNLSHTGSLADRTVVDDLAKKYFPFQQRTGRLGRRTLLAERVLFAITLSNLNYTYQEHGLGKQGIAGGNLLLKALNDSVIERMHGETRVFDLHFKPIEASTAERYLPLNWVQYHTEEEMEIRQQDQHGQYYLKKIGSLSENHVWREMAATCVASGAFPLAFEPVALRRYRYEFGHRWPKAFQHYDQFTFTYIDGGALNNEPIKEAARLATYLDALPSQQAFDRWIIFVDPNVTEMEQNWRVNVHSRYGIQHSLLTGKPFIAPQSTLHRLVSSLPHLLSLLLHEAKELETDKIFSTLEGFETRKQLRRFYQQSIAQVPADAELLALRQHLTAELNKIRQKLQLPPHVLQLQHELLRILREEAKFFGQFFTLADEAALVSAVNEWVYHPQPSQLPQAKAWVQAMSMLLLDLQLKLVGKNPNLQLVPIAPFNFYPEAVPYSLLKLPGGALAGFAGFASVAASEYEVAYGKYCSQRILRDLNLIAQPQLPLALPAPFDPQHFSGVVKVEVQEAFVKRLKEMVPDNLSAVMPFLEGSIRHQVMQFVNSHLLPQVQTKRYEFRVQVPSDLFTLRSFAQGEAKRIEPLALNGGYYFIFHLQYDSQQRRWLGAYTDGSQHVYVDKSRLFKEEPSVGLALPDVPPGSDWALSPNPVFVADLRSQASLPTYIDQHSGIWQFLNDVFPLDEHLWGKDIWADFKHL